MRNNSVIFFGPKVQEEMSFKDISYLELWPPFCSAEQYHLYNFGRGHQEEHFCEIILNLDQWFRRRCHLKDLIWSSGGPCVQLSATIYAERRGHYGKPSCEVILNLDQWFRRCRLKKKFTDGRTTDEAHLEPSTQVS